MNKRSKPKSDDNRIHILGVEFIGWRFRMLAFVAGAVLLGAGSVIRGEYEHWRSSNAEQARAATVAAKSYEDLGDVPRRAGEFIATKREGGPSDVRTVGRLLRSMMFDIENDRYSVAHFQTAIGGRAEYWRRAFAVLSSNKSPASGEFGSSELVIFQALSDDLGSLLSPMGKRFDSEATDSAAAAQDGKILPPYE